MEMLTNNPFDDIVRRLEFLQMAVTRIEYQINKPQEIKIPDPERLINLIEAAAIIKRPVGTVRRYIHHRGLPATKVGKGFLIKHSQLITWFNEFNSAERTEEVNPVSTMAFIRIRYKK